jgi:hypothetical protein
MNFIAYQQLFEDILNGLATTAPYDSPDYLNYAKLNWSRQHRWLKSGILDDKLSALIETLTEEQFWFIITEPWCGDAAHTVPFLHRLSELNPLIKVDYQLRDDPPFLIDQYLTHGSKSIPKLIIKNSEQKDLVIWGPRPAGCQLLYDQLIKDHVDMELKKITLQKWYNEDKGVSLQNELFIILSEIVV